MYEGLLVKLIHDKWRAQRNGPGSVVSEGTLEDTPADDIADTQEPTPSKAAQFWTGALNWLSRAFVCIRRNTAAVNDTTHTDKRNSATSVESEYIQKTISEIRREGLGLVVSILDFCGQRVFDVIHSFFLGPNGVYVLIFNMEWMQSDLRDSCLDHLKSWVNALIVHSSVTDTYGKLKCASIALVGTHKDKVPDAETHRDISKELQKLLSSSVAWRSLLEYKTEDGKRLCFFPVDCTQGQADPTMVNLMTAIETDVLQTDYVDIERPLSYFKVLDKMIERKKTASYLSLDEVSAIANKYRVGSQDVIEDMLRFFRGLGLIMWYEEPSLRNFIILDPIEFFVMPAANIVCQHVQDKREAVYSKVLREAQRNYSLDFSLMKDKGIVSSELLKFVLQEHMVEKSPKDTPDMLDHSEAVLKLMSKFSLIVPMFDDMGEDDLNVTVPRQYLVPSLLSPLNASGDLSQIQNAVFIWCSIESCCVLISSSTDIRNGFLPPGLFERFALRILSEIDGTRGGHWYEFLNRDQVWFYIGRTKFTLTALKGLGGIRIECVGEVVYGPLKMMAEILADVKTECFKELRVAIMAPFPPIGDVIGGLIQLDMLNTQTTNFECAGVPYDIDEMKRAYAKYLQPNILDKPYDVFISYRWGEPQKTIVRTLYNRLSRTLLHQEKGRPLHVYLDEKENKFGDNFLRKICSALQGTKIFIALITEDSLLRMKTHNPSEVDNVLYEWVLALSTNRRILPILLGKKVSNDENNWDELDIKGLMKDLPDIKPEKTVKLVNEHLNLGNAGQTISEISEWTVKEVVERFFVNIYEHWMTNGSLLVCRERILKILNEDPSL